MDELKFHQEMICAIGRLSYPMIVKIVFELKMTYDNILIPLPSEQPSGMVDFPSLGNRPRFRARSLGRRKKAAFFYALASEEETPTLVV